ncbi:Protein mpe1 [Tilletia horrida]|uniref:Protein mpe1 n=1 Tax=Tilletia horrida TaxID=155126 RepID=A0AAN6GU54_9BASI|nr:Protein mpe1 [Tilletia horrida]KAK0556077.1 Protein mpe1 [Tilletia horrida]KAK0568758.1 Protein mpe1 [Tilletia horrida]
MASASVYYKFRSQKDFSRITFDGTGISVWDLKREIILQNKMGRGQDFDLKLFNADTGQEYTDDQAIVPRSSQVTAQRAPPSRPNEGTAQRYVAAHFAGLAGAAGVGGHDNGPGSRFSHNANAGGVAGGPGGPAGSSAGAHGGRMGAMSRRFDGKADPAPAAPANTDAGNVDAPTGDEASSIAAMFAASNAEWDTVQQGMSTATYVAYGGLPRRGRGRGGGRGGGSFSDRKSSGSFGGHGASGGGHKPPGPGYICYRCGQKGHWIQDCPTNDDHDFDNRPRLKRTTGIPKSMLKTVEQPADGTALGGGVMITPDGSYVIAQTDTAAWQKNQALAKPLSENDVYAQVPSDSSLACPLCAKLLRNAVKTPCCGTLYCEECIQTHLLEHEFQCAECEKRIPDLADLKRDEETVKKVRAYVEEAMTRHEKGEAAQADAGDGPAEEASKEEEGPEGDPGPNAAEAGAEADTSRTRLRSPEAMKREGSSNSARHGTPTGGKPSTPIPGKHGLPAKPVTADIKPHNSSSSNNNNANGANGFGNPAMLLPQMMMMLQNPNLPPQVRMQLQMNVNMIQAQLMGAAGGAGSGPQQQQWNNPMMGLGGMAMGLGMNMAGGGGGMMGQRPMSGSFNGYQQHNANSGAYERGHQPNWTNAQGMHGNQANRKRDRGQADLVEVGGGGAGTFSNEDSGEAGDQAGESGLGSAEIGSPASKIARTS